MVFYTSLYSIQYTNIRIRMVFSSCILGLMHLIAIQGILFPGCLGQWKEWAWPADSLQRFTNDIWVFPKIGVFTPKWMVYNGKPY